MEGTAKKRSVNRAGKSSSEPFLDHGELAREFRLADAQIAAGHYFRHEDMKAWLLSWGKKNELPPPKWRLWPRARLRINAPSQEALNDLNWSERMNIPELQKGAEAGNVVDQAFLGLCYLYGYEVETNYKEALRLLSRAAQRGAPRAVLNLAHMYARGLGIEQNMPEAIRLYESVAKSPADEFAAYIELGRIYSRGVGVAVDREAAAKWYSAAIARADASYECSELEEAKLFLEQTQKNTTLL